MPVNQDVIITCALTGAGDTVGRSPHVPVTPEQIAASAVEAAGAGAAVVHIHVRDPETGAPSRDPRLYREVVERIRETGTDVVINLTAGMGGDLVIDPAAPLKQLPGTDLVGGLERLPHVEDLLPDICTLDCGSLNFGDGSNLYVSTPDMLADRREAHPGARGPARAGDLRHRAALVRQAAHRRGAARRPHGLPALHGHSVGRARRSGGAPVDGQHAFPRAPVGRASRSAGCRCPGSPSRSCSAGTSGSVWRTTSIWARASRPPTASWWSAPYSITEALGSRVASPDEARQQLGLRPRT